MSNPKSQPKKYGSSTGLGKGFESLIPTNFDPSLLLDSKDRIQKLFITSVQPNKEQPRRHFDETALKELATSIKRFGILQPLIVQPLKGNNYQIIAGERRWRASKLAGLEQIPVIVRQPAELEQLEIALIENVQRVDLSPLEQAVSIEKLHQQFNLTYQDIAARLGKAVTTLNNIVRLLQLPLNARQALQNGQISEGHARAILSLKDKPVKQTELLNLIISNAWSVRQAEQYVIAQKSGAATPTETKQRMATQTPATIKLAEQLHTKVSLKHTARGGRLEIHFKTATELEHLFDCLDKV